MHQEDQGRHIGVGTAVCRPGDLGEGHGVLTFVLLLARPEGAEPSKALTSTGVGVRALLAARHGRWPDRGTPARDG